MYKDYFGFKEAPFSIAPDPRYLYMSERHREALAHLLYGLKVDGGFVLLTGEVGTGKTTVCRCLLEQVPENCDLAYIVNPKLNTIELLRTLCEELRLNVPSARLSVKVLVDLINFRLLESNARGRKTVLIVDEAQNLSNDVLEQLRLLTNLETDQRKLLQIILLGQPELRQRLAEPDMRQLAQRVVARYHLEPLSRPDVAAYVGHRLAVAGARHALFPDTVLQRLHRLSGGTPRLINLICDRALLGAYVEGKPEVDAAILAKAAREALGDEGLPRRRLDLPKNWVMGLLAVLTVALLLIGYRQWQAQGTARSVAGGAGPATQSQPLQDGTRGAESQPLRDGTRGAESQPPRDGTLALAWPAQVDPALHEVMAVRDLYAAWGVSARPESIDAACARYAAQGLHCTREKADLAQLRALNTPALVLLRASGGADYYGTLVGLEGDSARLLIAGQSRSVDARALAARLADVAVVLWKGPPAAPRPLGPGARGPAVDWLAQRIAQWDGGEPRAAGLPLDAALSRRVRAFQRARGLDEDGLAGPQTFSQLAKTTAQPEEPRLQGAGR